MYIEEPTYSFSVVRLNPVKDLRENQRKHAGIVRKTLTTIKDNDQYLAERWHYNVVEYNPKLFDPSWLYHVGQDRERVEGNCSENHKKMGETPCTNWKTCLANNEKRKKWFAERHKGVKERKRLARATKKEKLEQEQQQRDNWSLSSEDFD